jgi:hypothetical protein
VSFLASYTFSKAIDDASSSSNFGNAPSNAQCRCDLRGNKGPSAFDIKHRAVISFTAELPFGEGKWLAGSNGVNKIIGGWQINAIASYQSGPSFQINTSGDNASIGTGAGSSNNQRPNLVGDPYGGIDTGASLENRGVNPGTYYFNRAAFVVPPQFLGNLGKDTLYGPVPELGRFALQEHEDWQRINTQFRAEFFNIFNHPNFNVPGLILNTSTFGVITGTVGDARIIQFGLKILFAAKRKTTKRRAIL